MALVEIYGGIGAFKTMFDMAKGLKDINDAAARNAAVIELQGKIMAAQAEQAALIDHIGQLEEKVRRFETWDAEKKRYDLKDLGWGALAYMLKAEARGTEPPHWVCTNCYGDGRVSIIQHAMVKGEGQRYICPACKNQINPSYEALNGNGAKWMD